MFGSSRAARGIRVQQPGADTQGAFSLERGCGPNNPAFTASVLVTYARAANFNGSDSFSYRIVADGVASNVATVQLQVNAVNDAPTLGTVALEVDAGSSVVLDPLASAAMRCPRGMIRSPSPAHGKPEWHTGIVSLQPLWTGGVFIWRVAAPSLRSRWRTKPGARFLRPRTTRCWYVTP